MPRTAPRAPARHLSIITRSRVLVLRVVVGACALVAGFSATPGVRPAPADPVDQEQVFLPAGEGRTVSSSAAGWTASAQVTAVGCGGIGCPAVAARWESGRGVDGGADGALHARLSGLGGQSGTATVTWRSPVVLTPAAADETTFSVMARRSIEGAATAVSSTVAIRVVPVDGGLPRTAVESAAVGGTDGVWTSGPAGSLGRGAFPPGSLHRIEVELVFRFDSRSSGQVDLDLDNAGAAVAVPRYEAPTAPPLPGEAPGGPRADAPGPSPDRSTITDARLIAPVVLRGAQLAGCHDDEIAILGAAAAAGRITVVGGSTRPPGTAISVQSTDGWRLGGATVDPAGLFRVVAREPAAAAPIRRVTARFPDGEASAVAGVERANVLRRVARVGRRVVVEGTLSGAARVRAATVRIESAAEGSCETPRPVLRASAKVDRRTGNYRALLAPPADRRASEALRNGALIRAQVATKSPGLPRRVTTSQAILVDGSVIPVH